jgi:hypothetical protein
MLRGNSYGILCMLRVPTRLQRFSRTQAVSPFAWVFVFAYAALPLWMIRRLYLLRAWPRAPHSKTIGLIDRAGSDVAKRLSDDEVLAQWGFLYRGVSLHASTTLPALQAEARVPNAITESVLWAFSSSRQTSGSVCCITSPRCWQRHSPLLCATT